MLFYQQQNHPNIISEKAVVGQDCIDPQEKKNRIAIKSAYLEERMNVLCQRCCAEMEPIPCEDKVYKCEECGCTWENVEIHGRCQWILIYDPEDMDI